MFLLLFLLWIILNGKFNLEIVLVGLFICAIIYLFACAFLEYSIKKDLKMFKLSYLLIAYIFLLVIEIIKANLNVIKVIFSKKKVDPEIIHFQVDLKSNFLRTIYANSITITPGTITIVLTEDGYTVHALKKEFANGIENSKLVKLLQKMEAK